MKKVYAVILRLLDTPVSVASVATLDDAMTRLGDWYRFNGLTWLVETETSSEEVRKYVTSLLSRNDSVIILKLDLSDYNGLAPGEVWKWLANKVTLADALRSPAQPYPKNAMTGFPGSFDRTDGKK